MSPDVRNGASRLRGRLKGMSTFRLGATILIVGTVALVLLVFKPQLQTLLSPGEEVTAEFERNYLAQLFPDQTSVKVSGLQVGKISEVEYTERGTTLVTMKVNNGVRATLGPAPTATIAPRTLLQGLYSVELVQGGGPGEMPDDEVIPVERTSVPQELDRILEALPKPTLQSMRDVVGQTDEALGNGAGPALGNLVKNAPGTLRPAKDVLQSVQGTRPNQDLPELVGNLENTANVLSRENGQLTSIVDSLATTSRALGRQARPLGQSIAMMPETLDLTREGLHNLDGTLYRLTKTAPAFRPAARELSPTLKRLDPVLDEAQPLLKDLRPLLQDARPLVKQLTPTAPKVTAVLNDLRGGTLDRLNGPIKQTVLSNFRGTGPAYDGHGAYASGANPAQANNKFYEELGYMVTNLDRASERIDAQGSLLGFQAGAGPATPRPGEQFKQFDDLVTLFQQMLTTGALNR